VNTLAAETKPRVIAGLEGLRALVGQEIAVSPWMEVTAARIKAFADATGDHQWIHLDVERAARESPYGGIVAHGYLTLSLIPVLRASALTITGIRMGINYGTNRVRFPAPLLAGRRVRGHFTLASFEPIEGGAQLTIQATVIEEGAAKPCCVAEVVTRLYPENGV
jgi:acyl dehydratase